MLAVYHRRTYNESEHFFGFKDIRKGPVTANDINQTICVHEGRVDSGCSVKY